MQYQEYFCKEYLDKIYYFCLKKTGSETEAADLSSDISLQILQALHNNTIPEHFAAWVWRIARNRYARWVNQKYKRITSECAEDITDFDEILTDGTNISDEIIRCQDMKLLSRELAFIRSDYRNLLLAYYIQGKKIKDIASEYQLPENTIKTRLYNSRKKLKEGMDMAREFGKLSYNPEHISFGFSVYTTGESGEPYSLIRRAIPKNIIIETYRNPSTAEQLSLELGIALPYIENEIDELLHSTLLSKVGDRYVTNIVILSKEAQTDMYAKFLKSISACSNAVRNVVEAKKSYFNKKGIQWTKTCQSEEDQKWSLVTYEYGRILMKLLILRNGNGGMMDFDNLPMFLTKRPNGGVWDIIGKEMGSELEPVDHWLGNDAIDEGGSTYILQIDLEKYRQEGVKELNQCEDAALNHVILGRAMECDIKVLKQLEEWGYILNVDGLYRPCCLDINKSLWLDEAEQSTEVIQAYHMCIQIIGEYYDYCINRIKRETIKNENINMDFCVQSFLGGIYPMIVDHLLDDGYLQFSNNKMVGVYHLVM